MSAPWESAEWIAKEYARDGKIADLEVMILRHMEHHIERAARAEREACAKVILDCPAGFGDLNRNDVADRIRNREHLNR